MGADLFEHDAGVLFKRCLLASAALHFALLLLGNVTVGRLPAFPRPEMVVDLTLPLRATASAPAGRLGRLGVPVPSPVSTPVVKTPAPLAAPAQPPKPEPAPVPAANPRPAPPVPQPVVSAPAVPQAPPTPGLPVGPAGSGGSVLGNPSGSAAGDPTATGGGGTGPGGRALTPDVMPRLLNKSEVLEDLRRFYPEDERSAGREATVTVKIIIEATGATRVVGVLTSGGAAFDAAARQVAERMRFSPATAGGKAISVATRQDIVFKLE